MAMQDNTPYRIRPLKEILREIACMKEIFAQAEPVLDIYEAFGGTGQTAIVLHKYFPNAFITASDLDQECCDTYNNTTKGFGHCNCIDTARGFSYYFNPKGSWGASLDFNRFTLLDLDRREGLWKRQLIKQICKREPLWVQLTDSAVCYLGTNWKRYGLMKKDLNDYVDLLSYGLRRRYGLKLIAYANHSRATYLLFERVWHARAGLGYPRCSSL